MFTAEEKQQIKQLEDAGCQSVFETSIKEVEGGYIIAHQTSYVLDGEVKGVTREQMVASEPYQVTRTIAALYGSAEKDEPTQGFSEQVYDYTPTQGYRLESKEETLGKLPTQKGNGKLQEPYYPAREYVQAQTEGKPIEPRTAHHVNEPGG